MEVGNSGFRFARIDLLDDSVELHIKEIRAISVFRDIPYKGSFRCNDERLNRIWETGAYTLLLNMQDYIYDGAKRDRLVWMGDLHPEICGILSVFDDVSLIPASLDFVRDHTPLPRVMNNITSYSLWWIVNQYEYYLHRGDLVYLQEQREYLTGLLRQLEEYVNQDGSEMVPPRRFLDWPNNDNPVAMHAGLQGLLCRAFQCGAKLCGALGIDASRPL